MATAKKSAAKKVARAAAPMAAVKKETRRKTGPKPTRQLAFEALGIDAVCSKIINGKTLTDIAKEQGAAIGTLLTWLASNPDFSVRAREARTQAAKVWDEEALQGIKDAKDAFSLAKAREAAQHLRWRASKIASKDYGDKLAVGQADDLLPLVTVKDLTGRKD